MIERVVGNWLTSVGERQFETPFAQLLIAEGHRVLHGPVHHAFEHGKDILTINGDGELCAFQLKGGDLDLKDIETYQGQLLAACATAVTHPAVQPPRVPDRVYVVTNGSLTAPARDRIALITMGNLGRGLGTVEPVEREQLLGRFLRVHESYFPTEPEDFATFLKLYLNDGMGPLPIRDFARFIEGLLPFNQPEAPRARDCQRALSSAALLSVYSLSAWDRQSNHIAVAEGWLVFGAATLRLAEMYSLPETYWRATYDLVFEASQTALVRLISEATEAEDLVRIHPADGAFYGTRALIVCGYASAVLLSETLQGTDSRQLRSQVETLLKRELRYLFPTSERATPFLLNIAWALGRIGEFREQDALVYQWLTIVSQRNQPESKNALPDPYHTFEDVLEELLITNVLPRRREKYEGHAYGAHICVEWLTRRWLRQHLALIWPSLTKIDLCEFTPSVPDRYLSAQDEEGTLRTWRLKAPGSWAELLSTANAVNLASVPNVLMCRKEFLPYLPLIFPHRLTSDLAKVLDFLLSRKGEQV